MKRHQPKRDREQHKAMVKIRAPAASDYHGYSDADRTYERHRRRWQKAKRIWRQTHAAHTGRHDLADHVAQKIDLEALFSTLSDLDRRLLYCLAILELNHYDAAVALSISQQEIRLRLKKIRNLSR